ncbi:DnaB-like helicase C-terminal domain-containing protein [Glycomyces paridis]|uniref:SF4 helicase domain-containing protein n=1 Tax=Glycomyces paridis TaxID=2126555 RepID=A0A4S8PEY1_9ACTN|nr:DnaB-like helicase C-terminal domain-containing protein [Glycomyces paridis]THV28993.1 hypothetical protein E9998_09580 [Glycomyces paridis]
MDGDTEEFPRTATSSAKFTTGMNGIDGAVGYFAAENLITIASKDRGIASTLAINIVSHAVFEREVPTMVLLPGGRDATRFESTLRACRTGIPAQDLTPSDLSTDQRRTLEIYGQRRTAAPLVVHAPKQLYYDQVPLLVRESELRPQLVLLDAVQLLDFEEQEWDEGDEDRYYYGDVDRPSVQERRADQLAEVSRGLKQLASSGGTTVIALTHRDLQVGQDYQGPSPDPGGLEAYDAFLKDSDVVLEVDPPDMPTDTRRKVQVRKNRWGPDHFPIVMTVDRTTYRMHDSTQTTGPRRR